MDYDEAAKDNVNREIRLMEEKIGWAKAQLDYDRMFLDWARKDRELITQWLSDCARHGISGRSQEEIVSDLWFEHLESEDAFDGWTEEERERVLRHMDIILSCMRVQTNEPFDRRAYLRLTGEE